MSAQTPGPWRWVVNPKNKEVDLSRGQYGESVLRFARWGMNGATPLFRDNGVLKRAEEVSRPEPGREHHAEWWRIVDHPDANLIASAPDLLGALEQIEGRCARISEETLEVFQLRHELREVRLAAHSAIAVARGAR